MKKVIFVLSLASVLAIITMWNEIYWQILIPMAKANTLVLLTTGLTVSVTITSALIAYMSYRSGEWKAHLSLNFGFQRASEYNALKSTGIFRSKYANTSSLVTGYNPQLMDIETRFQKHKDSSFPIAYNALTIGQLRIRNTGRGELRFSLPVFGSSQNTIPVNYIECRKNGVLIKEASDQTYFELKSGEVLDFYYNIVDLARATTANFRHSMWNDFIVEFVPKITSNEKLVKKLKQPALLKISIKDNRENNVELPRSRSWKFFSNQVSLDSPTKVKQVPPEKVAHNVALQLIAGVIHKELLKQQQIVDLKKLFQFSSATLETLIYYELIEFVAEAGSYLPVKQKYIQVDYNVALLAMALEQFGKDDHSQTPIINNCFRGIAEEFATQAGLPLSEVFSDQPEPESLK